MASTKFSAPIRKNSIIGMMVEVERHHKTIGVILTLRKWCNKIGNFSCTQYELHV